MTSGDLDWLDALMECRRRREPAVLVTVSEVVGHAPREVGAKMLVTADASWGSIGGGNLEQAAILQARETLAAHEQGECVQAQLWHDTLSAAVTKEFGRQCCGGRVTLLSEPLLPRPSVAIVGMGHVGAELARILVRHPIDLHVLDSRPERVDADVLADIRGPAHLTAHHTLLPEAALADVSRETHLLIMTHDHAEDFAVLDAALREREPFASIGVIGSTAKWQRFRADLLKQGHSPEGVDAVECPIGSPVITGKEPAVIALSIAAAIVPRVIDRASEPPPGAPSPSARHGLDVPGPLGTASGSDLPAQSSGV